MRNINIVPAAIGIAIFVVAAKCEPAYFFRYLRQSSLSKPIDQGERSTLCISICVIRSMDW